MIEVVVALIWDNDKFIMICQRVCCGSSLAVRLNVAK